MNNQEKFHRLELIEKYCNNTLSPSEILEFEELYKNDSTLAEEVEEYKKIVDLLRMSSVEKTILSTLERLENEDRALEVSPIKSYKAAFFLLITTLAACVIFVLYASLTAVQLPDFENDLTIVRNTEQSVLNSDDKEVLENLNIGQRCFKDGNFSKAVEHFENVLDSQNTIRPYYQEAAEWHLIVSYLKNDQVKEAKMLYKKMDNLSECVYPISSLDKIKLWWQIFWANLLK